MRPLLFLATLIAGPALAEVPDVATDIAPIHGLTARVMQGVGEPSLIIPPGASPHSYAMRPSEARALSAADLVIWMGPGLTPWLAEPLDTLAPDADRLTLLEGDAVALLPVREGYSTSEALGDDHDHDHAEEGHDGEDHEDHTDHEDHEDHADHPDHEDHDHDHDVTHDHGTMDPHAWLDPANGAAWGLLIADRLSAMDPEHSNTYQANAAALAEELESFHGDWAPQLAALKDRPFLVYHDAYQYFERSFDLHATAAVATTDAATPGAAHISDVQAHVARAGVVCAFSEPQHNSALLDTATEGLDVRSGVIDPLGAEIPLGPEHYLETLRAVAQSVRDCLAP